MSEVWYIVSAYSKSVWAYGAVCSNSLLWRELRFRIGQIYSGISPRIFWAGDASARVGGILLPSWWWRGAGFFFRSASDCVSQWPHDLAEPNAAAGCASHSRYMP